VSSNAQP
jgi:hypothetical protein